MFLIQHAITTMVINSMEYNKSQETDHMFKTDDEIWTLQPYIKDT